MESTMKKNAIVIITDKNFFLPSFGAALSAARNLTRRDTFICIFVTDVEAAWCETIADVAAPQNISVLPAHVPEIRDLEGYHEDRWLPAVALSRFWVHRFLPPEVERFLYLDGDVLVDGNIDNIFDSVLPESGIMAAPDTVCLCLSEMGRGAKREKSYLEGLGIQNGKYFNSGVMLADVQKWRQISEQATKFLVQNSTLCRSSDQSALNAVTRNGWAPLSLRWNYQSDHMTILDPRTIGIKPVIWHLSGGPKPWHLPEWPWDESFTWAYREAKQILKGQPVPNPAPIAAQLEAGVAHRRRTRFRLKWFYPWRRLTRGRIIRKQLAAA
jgi:lipopolysaccharide biosynthesis glycosyltransferase